MEMHLEARRDMIVVLEGRRVSFARGETIHTESSTRYTEASVRELAAAAGWAIVAFETSPDPAVALALLEA